MIQEKFQEADEKENFNITKLLLLDKGQKENKLSELIKEKFRRDIREKLRLKTTEQVAA